MPFGVIVNTLAVFIGSMIGGLLRHYVPEHLKETLPKVFGVCAMSIGITSLVNVQTLPIVIMSLIIGTVIGEMLHIDRYVSYFFEKILKRCSFKIEGDHSAYMEMYLLVVVMFCMSGTGIFGALVEGMSGDSTVLMSKSILDFFTAILFGTTLGYAQALIPIPQFVILFACFLIAKGILPYVNDVMIMDFKACGGLMTIILGMSVAKILHIKAINLIPSLVIVMPLVGIYQILL
ncbi:MAG: DUF554 domain-containing protein [Beduini sp.]|uniref:DUF554 domain-containing protein n=1 Tax=Beduini sp. TaxID=1922300 RepID=UPI0011CA50C7